jgi:hypothetical protein
MKKIPPTADRKIIYRPDIKAPELKDQEHLDRPTTDSKEWNELLDDLFII